jgi:hypothetical protein
MAKDVSNNLLAVFLVASIIVAFAGIIFSVAGFRLVIDVTGGQVSMYSSYGTVGINISQQIEITLISDIVDFGEGYRHPLLSNDSECNLSTYDVTRPSCWINLTMYPPVNFSHFRLENVGNVPVNLTVNSSNASVFFGGPIIGGTPRYMWRGVHVTGDDGCVGGNLTASFVAFDSTEQLLCALLLPADYNDMLDMSINISIPAGPRGHKSGEVTFTARRSY